MASRETLFSSVCTAEKQGPKQDWKGKESLKQALKKRTKLLKYSPPEFMSQFESTTRVFSTYYLGEGPGIEKDSVLNLKACYSGKTARLLLIVFYLLSNNILLSSGLYLFNIYNKNCAR